MLMPGLPRCLQATLLPMPSLIFVAFALALFATPAEALDEDTKDTVQVLSDLMARGCGLGGSVTISGEAAAIGLLGFRLPGVTGQIEGTYQEIPTILRGLVPDGAQATETRNCMKEFMHQIFDAILTGTIRSPNTKKEIKRTQLKRTFSEGDINRKRLAMDAALASGEQDLQDFVVREALRSGSRELRYQALNHLLSQATVLGGTIKYRDRSSAIQVLMKDYNVHNGEFSGMIVSPTIETEQEYGSGRLSGVALSLANNACALHVELDDSNRMNGLLTCKRIRFGGSSYTNLTVETSLSPY